MPNFCCYVLTIRLRMIHHPCRGGVRLMDLCLVNEVLEKTPLLHAACIATLGPSMETIKKEGERGSLCRPPFDVVNSSVGFLLIKIEVCDDCRQPFIHILHLPPKPICIRLLSKKSQFNESKALSKSTLKSRVFFLVFFAPEYNPFTMSSPSNMLLPSMNVDCTL